METFPILSPLDIPMHRYAGLLLPEGGTRVTHPGGPIGDVEELFREHVRQVGYRVKHLPEVEIYDYGGIGRTKLRQDVWFVKDNAAPPGPYQIEYLGAKLGDPDDAWAVVSTPNWAVASCWMKGACDYLGTREQAQQWADALNMKFGTFHPRQS